MASPQSLSTSQAPENNPTSTPESQTIAEGAAVAHRRPNSHAPSEPLQDTDPPHKPECSRRPILTYTRRQLLNLYGSPLVQRPEGMPALKDWFGDWSEQHAPSQVKKDATDANGATGNRRFSRRDQEEGDNSTRPAFRSTLSQPSQMGNFKHQSLRGDLTRGDRERDRDRDNERDKEGHERLRSLSDMYDRDRDRMAIPLTLPPLLRAQQRDSAPHLSASALASGATSSGRLSAREGRDRSERDKDRDRDRERDRDRDRDRDRESGRRGENREGGRRKGGESVDWRRGAEPSSRGGKDERSDNRERGGAERERSPEVERSRRDQSVSRERWSGARDREEGSRREPKGRERERDKDRDREYPPSSSRARRDRTDARLRQDDERATKDKEPEKDRVRTRDDDRRSRLRDLEGHPDRGASGGSGRDRWAERPRDVDRGEERKKGRDDGEKETKEERRERDRDRRERDRERERERERAREHPDTKRDRELREGWTIAEEREARQQLAPATTSRRGAGRGERRAAAVPDEEKETRRDRERERDKEPAWMDDYVPEPGLNKAGIFGGKIEGMDDDIQAWKKKQTGAKTSSSAEPQAAEPPSEPLSVGSFDGNGPALGLSSLSVEPGPNDEQAKATEAFFFGLMRSESSKVKTDSSILTGSPRPSASSNVKAESVHSDSRSARHSPAPGLSLATPNPVPIPRDHAKDESATALLSTLGVTIQAEATRDLPVTAPSAPTGGQPNRDAIQHPSPAPPLTSSIQLPTFSPAPDQMGSNILADEPPAKTPNSQPSVPFNPPQQSRVLAFSAQSQPPSDPQLRPLIVPPSTQGQPSPARAGVIGPQPSPQPHPSSQPGRMQPSPLVSDPSSRVPSLTEQATQRIQAAENMHHRSAFSPFDSNNSAFSPVEGQRHSIDTGFGSSRQQSITSPVDSRSNFSPGEGMHSESRNPRMSPQAMLSNSGQAMSYDGSPAGQNPSPNSAASTYASGRGSRFARFWDGKTKEAAAAGFMQAQAAAGIMSQGGHSQQPPPPPQSASPSASQPQRQSDHVSPNGFLGNTPTGDNNIQEMLTMLQNSTQSNRLNTQGNPMGGSHGIHRQHPSHLQALHEQQIPHHQPQPQHHFSNANSLLDNHQFENRPFVPDGMVPGLRPPRSRESSIPGPLTGPLYTDTLDDSSFTVQQRMPAQQQVFEQLPGRASMPQLYSNQAPGGNRSAAMFQPPFRAEPSPLGGHNPLIGGQQRLPPGLANLGGRPPHDPNGYLGAMGMSGGGMHGPHQPSFNSFGGGLGGGGGAGLGFGGVGHGPPPPPPPPPQRAPMPMQTLLNNTHNALAASGHPDFTVQHHPGVRGPPPGQMMQGAGGGGGMRGGFPPQGGLGPVQHMQAPHVGMRQQQGPHLVPQMLPPHLQQQQQHQHQHQHQHQQQVPLHNLHGGGQSQNDHLLSMLMEGIGPR